MIVAFLCSITLLPALLALFNPPGEPHPMGFTWLAPVDRFTAKHRIAIVVITLLMVLAATPLLLHLPFDFNPTHLQDPNAESVKTYLELRKRAADRSQCDRDRSARPQGRRRHGRSACDTSAGLADDDAEPLHPAEPGREDQAHPRGGADDRSLSRPGKGRVPADRPTECRQPEDDGREPRRKRQALIRAPGPRPRGGSPRLLTKLAGADPEVRMRAEAAVAEPLRFALRQLRLELDPQHVTVDTIPQEIARQWVTPDGRARIQVLPSGDPENTDTLHSFVTAVLAIAPDATGPAVLLYEAARTVIHAFIVAGVFALSAITVLLLIALRRVGDVLLTLVPLLVAGAVTLELCVILGIPLNFANIIALPLLLGVGVAFKIYYILAWRAGKTNLLQSGLTRAVIFSAMTTASAFGSLWLSENPGTSSMGKMMALALVCTMAAAVFFQPVLMGPPRKVRG